MVKRHAQASFGSTFAFPGGVLEASDTLVHDLGDEMSAAQADDLLQLDHGALDYFSAAIRELFEESGVLLATHQLSTAHLESARVALNDGSLTWDRFAHEQQLRLYYERLHYFSFWITPTGLPKRYAARFFLAELPKTQVASHDGAELIESCWMSAADVLAARKKKLMKLPYVTRKTLQRMVRFTSTQELLDWARACGKHGVICDQPAFKPEKMS